MLSKKRIYRERAGDVVETPTLQFSKKELKGCGPREYVGGAENYFTIPPDHVDLTQTFANQIAEMQIEMSAKIEKKVDREYPESWLWRVVRKLGIGVRRPVDAIFVMGASDSNVAWNRFRTLFRGHQRQVLKVKKIRKLSRSVENATPSLVHIMEPVAVSPLKKSSVKVAVFDFDESGSVAIEAREVVWGAYGYAYAVREESSSQDFFYDFYQNLLCGDLMSEAYRRACREGRISPRQYLNPALSNSDFRIFENVMSSQNYMEE